MQLGYQTKVYELFESAQFGIDWSSVDADIFAVGSSDRVWVDQKANELDKLYTAEKQAGLSVYCQTDMIVFPKKLVEKFKLTKLTHISDPETQKYLRAAIKQMFHRFPQLDGLVVSTLPRARSVWECAVVLALWLGVRPARRTASCQSTPCADTRWRCRRIHSRT
jgi:hypothetical protein